MNQNQNNRDDEVLDIAGRMRDGRASAEEIRWLEAELTANPANLRRYLRFVALDAQLALTSQAQATSDGFDSAALPATADDCAAITVECATYPRRRRATRILAGCVALAALVGGSWLYSSPKVEFVRGVGHQFKEAGPAAVRQNLVGREFNLVEGLVQLYFRDAKADVVIEAPARFRAEDAKTLRVDFGRVTAHVRDGKKGLRVVTSRMDVLDLGTRFAVDASIDRPSEVHVFEGKVEAGQVQSETRQLLGANRALRFDDGSSAIDCDLRNGSFVQPEEVPQLVNGLRNGQRERASRAYLRLKEESSLLLASDFNSTSAGAPIQIFGAKPVQGRFPGSKAFDFVDTSDCAVLDSELTTRQFTIMTWVRLNTEWSESPDNSLFHTDGWSRRGQVHWMISCGGGHRGQMRFAIHTGATGKTERTLWAVSDQSLLATLARWTHLAIGYDADRSEVSFFINGVHDKTISLPQAIPAVLGPAEIGNWSPNGANGEYTRRRLRGRMDEFLILSRKLSADEVNSYFRQTTPYQ